MRLLDWSAKEDAARKMSVSALYYSIDDCLEAAKAARLTDLEGYYHDEASVYRAEINRRRAAQ